MKNLLLVFSVYHIVVVTQTLNLKFLLGDNFFDIFFYDTFFSHCSVFKVQYGGD